MKYSNMDSVSNRKTFQDLRRWRNERRLKVKDFSWTVPQYPDKDPEFLRRNREISTVTWIGHSTFLLQLSGLNIVTDPVWAERMGLDRRLAPPGLALSELPPIDAVVLSHGHYDHLHFGSLRRLPGHPLYLVPAGLAGKFRRKGLTPVEELDWWESFLFQGVRFHFVPAQHWTRRTLFDMNRSHWGGWVLEEEAASEGRRPEDSRALYFAGDSGYFRGFREIGERFRIGAALMPIGAYEPEWFMGPQHVTPEEAVQAFLDAGAEEFVPMHYGAFRLADDTPREALDRLLAEWRRLGLPPERLHVLQHGQTLRLGGG